MRLTSRALLLPALALVIAGVWYLRSDGPTAAFPTTGDTVVAFGDSLVAGVGATPGRDFVSELSRRTGVRIVNAGRSGDTTAAALARFERDVLSRNPRIVIVLLGGNDLIRRLGRDAMFANLETIIRRIRERGAAVILAGVGFGTWLDVDRGDFEALARRTDAWFVPDILADIFGRPSRMHDSLHPNDEGHAMMADRIEPVLRRVLAGQ